MTTKKKVEIAFLNRVTFDFFFFFQKINYVVSKVVLNCETKEDQEK
jgi:hypothetical protein